MCTLKSSVRRVPEGRSYQNVWIGRRSLYLLIVIVKYSPTQLKLEQPVMSEVPSPIDGIYCETEKLIPYEDDPDSVRRMTEIKQ